MQYFLVVKECIFVLMEIKTINIEKDDVADLDLRESLYLKLILLGIERSISLLTK